MFDDLGIVPWDWVSDGTRCGLSAVNLAPQLPEVVKEVVMCLDGDLPGSPAFEASENAAQDLISRGLEVRMFRAPPGMDHNDLLRLPANVVPLHG